MQSLYRKQNLIKLAKINFFVHNSINILNQNINGLINKKDLLIQSLDELDDSDKRVDVICITEHNMLYQDCNILNIPNFTMANCFSRGSRSGGACILVRNNIKFKTIDISTKYSIPNIIECCAIKLVDHNIIVICLYRVPKNNDQSKNFDIFFNTLQQILTLYSYNNKILLCGDFNINILKKTNRSTEFLHVVSAFNLKFTIKEPTRLESGTCIDNIIHNIKGSKGEVIEFGISDHTAQLVRCPVKKYCTLTTWYTQKRDYSEDNLIKFVDCLRNLTFYDIYTSDTANDAFNKFYDIFLTFYDLCFPTIRIKHTTKKRLNWLSKGIKLCAKRKRKLLWKYRFTKTKSDRNKFKQYSNRLNKIIKLTQRSQNNNYIMTSKNKSKASWQIINNIKQQFPKETINEIKSNGSTIRDPKAIAQAFNDYYTNFTSASSRSDKHGFKKTITNTKLNSLYMAPTTPYDVFLIINDLKNTNSTGYDNINTKTVKHVSHIIASPLSHIINLCISEGVFPEKLKTTIIKPLFKKEDRENVECYRPIALIPIFSKIIEKVIYNSIYQYCETNNILVPQQKGFRKNKNINMALYEMLYKIYLRMDNRLPIVSLFLDLSKAFDCVDHKILIQKLEAIGIRGNVQNLLKSYLCGRTQMTQISRICPKTKVEIDYLSDSNIVHSGVPQGSVLGPLLFNIYINDIVKSINDQIILFADDSAVLYNNIFDINNSLTNIIDWLHNNNLQINLNKTKLINFKQRCRIHDHINITHDGHKIEETKVTKFLGLHLDQNMNWNTHIDYVCNRISQSSYALYKLSKVVNRKTVLVAYHGLVVSVLRYGIIFWGNATGKEDVFKAQKRCIRAICNLKSTDSCRPYFKDLKLLTMASLYIYEIAIFVRTNLNLFPHVESARRRDQLHVHPCKTALFHKSVFAMAPKLYNAIPKSIREVDNLASFKKQLYNFLADKAVYSVDEFFLACKACR